jgi:hypothetical protein
MNRMRCFLASLAIAGAVGCVVMAFGTRAWGAVQPLSAAEARATRGSQTCAQNNVSSHLGLRWRSRDVLFAYMVWHVLH